MELNVQTIRRPAGFWVRLLASILDAIVIMVPSYFIAGDWQGNMYTSILSLLYYLFLPVVWSGYTVGKRIVGIRIAKVNGDKVGFGTMLMRHIVGTLIYAITIGIAAMVSAFMVGLRKDKRAIHDFVAGTYVTHEKPIN